MSMCCERGACVCNQRVPVVTFLHMHDVTYVCVLQYGCAWPWGGVRLMISVHLICVVHVCTCVCTGIIDVLQEWTWIKRFERRYKILFKCHCADANDLSVMRPDAYRNRFCSYISEAVMDLPSEPEPVQVVVQQDTLSWLSMKLKAAWIRLTGTARAVSAQQALRLEFTHDDDDQDGAADHDASDDKAGHYQLMVVEPQ